jgi:MarR family transcriptional regulator, lower aerobic nicotinate degradation pathway regulator
VPHPHRPETSRASAIDALVSVAPAITRWIERLLAAHDPPLTLAQYLALRAIAEEGTGGAELARRTGVSGPAASQLIAALDGAGLVERTPVEGDRRRQALTLSAAGVTTLRSAERLLRRQLSSLMADVPPPEADGLAHGLEAVDGALRGRPPPRRPPPEPPRPGRGPTSPPGRPR